MMAHPELVAGERRLGTELMRAFPGAVLAKVGAEGVYGAALLDRGVGLALKVEDGHAKAAMIALVAVLDGLGLEPPAAERVPHFAEMPIVNTRCETVGTMLAAGKLTFV